MNRKRITGPVFHPLQALAAAVALLAPAVQAATFTWNGGTFVAGVTAPSPLPVGDVLDIGAGAFKIFSGSGSNFTNGGTVNWNADALYLQSGAAVVNNGLWNATSNDSLVYNGGAGPSFTNNGTFRKSAGAGTTTIGSVVGFVNNGTLDAQTGTISYIGGTVFNSGTVFTGAGVNLAAGGNSFVGSFSSSNLVLGSGTHSGSAAVLNGSVSWTGGTLDSTWTVAAGQTLNGQTGAFKFINGPSTVVTNQGTVNWNTADFLYLQSGGTFSNQGLFVANSSTTLAYNGGAAPTFDNTSAGTLRAAAGTTLTVGTGVGLINNGGVLDAQAGGSIAYVGGSAFKAGTQFTGAGSNVAAGGNSFVGSFQSANLVLASGTHTGAAAVLGGSVSWTGGTLDSTWTVAAGQSLNGQTGAFKFIIGPSTVVTNQGTVNWNTADFLYLQSGGTFSNQGLFVANSSTTLAYNGGAAPSFDNTSAGTLRAAAGTTLTVGTGLGLVNNGGVLNAQAGGSIVYVGGSTFKAGTQFTGAGSNVAAGANGFEGSFQSANLVLTSGTHSGSAAVLNGSVSWTGGTLDGTWTVAAGQTLNGANGGFKFISGAATVVSNQGTVAWNTNDFLYLLSGGTFNNAGTFNFAADGAIVYNGGAAPSVSNTGLIVKTAGTGTSTIGNTLNFSSQGTIDVQVGTIALPANFSNNGTLKGTGTFSVSGTLGNAGTVAPGASPGTLALSGSYAQAAAGTFAVELESLASHDLFNVSGTAALDGTLALSCYSTCSYAVGDVITILDSVGNLSGSFASVTLSGFATGAFSVVYDTAADRVQLLVTEAVTAVPEPETYTLLLAGLAAVGFLAKRRRGAAAAQ
jgi:hypothetical protein